MEAYSVSPLELRVADVRIARGIEARAGSAAVEFYYGMPSLERFSLAVYQDPDRLGLHSGTLFCPDFKDDRASYAAFRTLTERLSEFPGEKPFPNSEGAYKEYRAAKAGFNRHMPSTGAVVRINNADPSLPLSIESYLESKSHRLGVASTALSYIFLDLALLRRLSMRGVAMLDVFAAALDAWTGTFGQPWIHATHAPGFYVSKWLNSSDFRKKPLAMIEDFERLVLRLNSLEPEIGEPVTAQYKNVSGRLDAAFSALAALGGHTRHMKGFSISYGSRPAENVREMFAYLISGKEMPGTDVHKPAH